MYDILIEKYISKLNNDKIIEFGNKNNIHVNNSEASIILDIIKKDWKTLMYGNPTNIFNKLRNQIDKNKCSKIEDLYYKMKEKYL